MGKEVKCEKCNREFSDDHAVSHVGKVYVHKGTVLCEDCLVDMGVMPDSATPIETYIDADTDLGKMSPGAGL